MRLIDRDAITHKDICEALGRDYTSCAPDIEDLLDEQPTVEAEPVIRCKDCMYKEDYRKPRNENECYCTCYDTPKTYNGFCDEAKPKMDGKENG